MFLFYCSKYDVVTEKRLWHTYAYAKKQFYVVESYAFEMDETENHDNTKNAKKDFINSEYESFLKLWLFQPNAKNSPLSVIPHYDLFLLSNSVTKIAKFNNNVYPSCILLKDFIYEFTYLNRNRFKYICFVDFEQFRDDIETTFSQNKKFSDVKFSLKLIRSFLKKKFSPSIMTKVYSNNSMLLVDNEDTLVQLKLHFGSAAVRTFLVEDFIKFWVKVRTSKSSSLPYHYMEIHPKMAVVQDILKNARKVERVM